jgi:hypothetical protein
MYMCVSECVGGWCVCLRARARRGVIRNRVNWGLPVLICKEPGGDIQKLIPTEFRKSK